MKITVDFSQADGFKACLIAKQKYDPAKQPKEYKKEYIRVLKELENKKLK